MTGLVGGGDVVGASPDRVSAATIAAQRAAEHAFGRLLDLGVIVPRLTELYRWSADELQLPPVGGLICDATPAYAWDPHDREPWAPAPQRVVRAVRRALPPRAAASFRH